MDGKGNTTIIYYAVFLQAWMVKSICVVGIVFCLWFHGECIFKTQQEAFEPIAWYSQSTQKMVIKHAGVYSLSLDLLYLFSFLIKQLHALIL